MLRDAGMHVGIIGGGVAGLVAAYELAKQGQDVTVLEKHSRIGGMAGSFCLEDGHQIETYYHFICKPDRAYLEMMRELGIDTQLRWVTTKMGLFYKGGLHTLGDPVSLLRFPGLSWQDKLRFGLATVRAKTDGMSRMGFADVPLGQIRIASVADRERHRASAPGPAPTATTVASAKVSDHSSRCDYHRSGCWSNLCWLWQF
jgi:uncharacterized protein with NAD-binding domain and iron-sulfur cluster